MCATTEVMSGNEHIIARAPNHLGDGIMAIPALRALSRISKRFEIQAPSWGPVIYRGIDAQVVGRGPMVDADVAILFPPSFRVAWEARRARRRIGIAADWRRWLLTDVVQPGVHQRDTYRALAVAVGAKVDGVPAFEVDDCASDVDVPKGHIGLNPISKAGAVREWQGYARLAKRLDSPVVFYGGPGEEERVRRHAHDCPMHIGLEFDAFAKALQRCALFVSNDSGAAHFARACGVPTLVIYGSTTSAVTGPAGSHGIEGPDLECRPCYGRTCKHSLECLDVPVDQVLAKIVSVIERG